MIISIWQPSLIDAHSFIRENELEKYFIQFLEDKQMRNGYWIVFNNLAGLGDYGFVKILQKYGRLPNGKSKLSYI